MNKAGNIKNINFKKIAGIRRFHMVIFIVAVVVGLTVAILMLNAVVEKTNGSQNPTGNSMTSSFDQSTINRIKGLKTVDDPSDPLDFSKGRISPFSE